MNRQIIASCGHTVTLKTDLSKTKNKVNCFSGPPSSVLTLREPEAT